MKRHTMFIAAILGAALVAVGCRPASAPVAPPPPPTATTAPQAAPSSPSAATEAVSVTDALGRTVTFESLPRRIVVAGRATIMLVDALYLFPEAPQRLAAVGLTGQGQDFFPLLDPDAAAKTTLDNQAGPEQIAAAQPDLVLLKSYLAETLGAPLEALGIPVFYLTLESPEDYYAEIKALGQLLGNPGRAEQVVAFYQERVERVQRALSDLKDEQRPSVLILQHTSKGGETAYNVPPATWIQTRLTEMAGGRPVWLDAQSGGGWNVVTLEQIAAWNPDQIYIIDYFDNPAKAVAAFRSDPIAQNLKAVQADNVFAFPKDTYSWDQPDTRWILGLTWLASRIHPDRFTDVNIIQEFTDFQRAMYNLDDEVISGTLLPLVQATLP